MHQQAHTHTTTHHNHQHTSNNLNCNETRDHAPVQRGRRSGGCAGGKETGRGRGEQISAHTTKHASASTPHDLLCWRCGGWRQLSGLWVTTTMRHTQGVRHTHTHTLSSALVTTHLLLVIYYGRGCWASVLDASNTLRGRIHAHTGTDTHKYNTQTLSFAQNAKTHRRKQPQNTIGCAHSGHRTSVPSNNTHHRTWRDRQSQMHSSPAPTSRRPCVCPP